MAASTETALSQYVVMLGQGSMAVRIMRQIRIRQNSRIQFLFAYQPLPVMPYRVGDWLLQGLPSTVRGFGNKERGFTIGRLEVAYVRLS